MKNYIPKFLPFGLLFFVLLGCSMFKQEPQTITSDDGSCQLTVPGNWSKQTGLNKEATLQAANPREEVYVIVIRETKSDFPPGTTLDKVVDVVQDTARKNITSAEIATPSSTTIGGFPAKQFEAGGTVSGLKAKYLYAVVESPTSYYQIMTWTLADRYDKNKTVLQNAINSFKEIGGGNSSTVNSNTKKP